MTKIDSELLECAVEVVKEGHDSFLKKNPHASPLSDRTLRCFAREVLNQSKLGEDVWLNKKIRRAIGRVRYQQKSRAEERG